MTESADTASPTERLAIARLSSPGLVDSHALRHARDRFAPSNRGLLIDRLQRRIAPATPGIESLPLVRVDRTSAREAGASGIRSVGNAASVASAERAATVPVAPAAASSRVGSRVARSAPSVSRTPAIVARRLAEAPGVATASPVTSRILERSRISDSIARVEPGAMPASPVANALVQRAAAGPIGRAPAEHTEPAQASAGSPTPRDSVRGVRSASRPLAPVSAGGVARTQAPLVLRKADTLAQAPVAPAVTAASSAAAARAGDAGSRSAAKADLPTPVLDRSATGPATTAASMPLTTSRAAAPLILRKIDAAARVRAATALPAVSAVQNVSSAPPRLVLRKPSVPVAAAPLLSPAPSIAAAPASVIARTHDAYGPAPHHGESRQARDWDIDWIAEQVGRRLARRLEIERERTGIRSWRQAN